jgi:hypothetical protein
VNRDLLVVLNPRAIPAAMGAFEELDVDKLWIRRMNEFDVAEHWPQVLEMASGYERLFMCSDDGVVRAPALAAVNQLLDEGHPVATGYSNLSAVDYRVNLAKSPLASMPGPNAYDLYTLKEVQEWPTAAVPTYFSGFSLLGMATHLWERFPFKTHGGYPPGCCSDFVVCQDLHRAGMTPFPAAREGLVWHMKEEWNRADKAPAMRLRVGEGGPELHLERAA